VYDIEASFEEASIRLQTQLSQRRVIHCQPTHTNEKAIKPIISHLEYHPRGIQRSQVRQVYLDTLAPLLPDQNLILAVSRPQNLQDRVCSTRLPDIPGEKPIRLDYKHWQGPYNLPANFAYMLGYWR
jgi:hypothetical protein